MYRSTNKKTSFFSKPFFQHFLKSHRFFFLSSYRKQRKLCTRTSNNRIPHHELQKVNNSAAQIHIISEAKKTTNKNKIKHKKTKQRPAACCLPRTLRLHKQLLIFKTQDM